MNLADNLIRIGEDKEAKILLKTAGKLLAKSPEHKAWSDYYSNYAFLSEKNVDYTKSIKYMDSAIVFAIRVKDSLSLASNYHNRGFYNYNLANYESAVQDYLNAIALNEKNNVLNRLAGSYYILSVSYSALEHNELAKKYSLKGIAVSKKVKNDFITSLNYSILSESYCKLN